MSLTYKPKAGNLPNGAGSDPASAHGASEDEIAAVRARYRVPQAEPIDPWIDYARAMSVWHQRAAVWIMRLVASPDEYLRRTLANRARRRPDLDTPDWRRAWIDAAHTVRAQLLALARPDQTTVDLANEIAANRHLRLALANAGWIPPKPNRPGLTPDPARIGKTDLERDAAAHANAADWTAHP